MDNWGNSSYDGGANYGSSASVGGGGSAAAGRQTLNISAQLEIQKLTPEIQVNEIRSIFGRYGRIVRIVMDYSKFFSN